VSGLFLKAGRVGGAEFMLYGIVAGMIEAGSRVTLLLPEGEDADPSFNSLMAASTASGQFRIQRLPVRVNRFVTEAASLPRALRVLGTSRVLFPNYFTPPLPRSVRSVTSILDLQYLHFPEFFSRKKRAWLRIAHEMTLRSASTVSVISDFVRDDLLSRYGRKQESKVVTIPIGIDWRRFERSEIPVNSIPEGRPFVLSVASHYAHKNLETLLRAFARVATSIPHDLVLVGQRRKNLVGVRNPAALDLDGLAHELGIGTRVHFTGHAPDELVAWCYRHAAAFVFPSLFEGFGMPVVEALGMGLPVITTKCGSLPEVSRGLAHLVNDPKDDAELADMLAQVLNSPEKFAPTAGQVDSLRTFYQPRAIAEAFLGVLN
jgi:glycosyltransferase involved in cell wall biosynthesis